MTIITRQNYPLQSVCVGVKGGASGGGDGGGGDDLKNEFNKCCKIKVIRRCEDEN